MASGKFGGFKSFDKGPAYSGLAASGGFDPAVLFPKGPSVDLVKKVGLDWDKVLSNLNKGDKKYAGQAARALAATQAFKPSIAPTAVKAVAAASGTSVGPSSPPMSAIEADVAHAIKTGAVPKGALPSDVQNILKGKQYYDLDANGRALYRQMLRAQADIKRMGEKPHKDGPSILSRVMDVLSRGNYAAANAVKHSNQGIAKALSDGFQLKDVGSIAKSTLGVAAIPAAWEGLSGKEKTTFTELLKSPRNAKQGGYGLKPNNVAEKIGVGALGLAADIFLDPTTYLGVGAAKSIVKGGSASLRAVKAGDVIKDVGTKPGTLKQIHKEIDKLLDLDLESVGYKPLDEAGKPIEGVGTGLHPNKDIRRQQVESLFTSVRNHDGSAVSRQQVSAQLRNADHYLAHANKAMLAENAAKTAEALKIVNSPEFLTKTADQVYKDLESTAAADILQRMAREGKVFVDVPDQTIKKVTLNPEKYANFKKSMDKKIASTRGLLTKAKKAGKPQDELTRLQNKIYDLEHERNYHELYGKPLDDAAPDTRIYDVIHDTKPQKEALAHNENMAKELETRLAEIRPTGLAETHKTLLEIAAREIDPEVTRLIQVRFGGMFGGSGAVLATFKAPDVFRKAAEKFAREGYDRNALNLWNKATIGFSKAFRASGSLDKFIDAERLRTAGRANELIHLHVQDLRKKLGKIQKSDRYAMYDGWMKGVPPDGLVDEHLLDVMNDFELELADYEKFWNGSMVDQLGILDPSDLNRWLPKKRVKLVDVKDGTIPVGSGDWWRLALRESTSRDLAEVMHQLRIAKEKMIARATLTKNIESTLGIARNNMDNTFQTALRKDHGYTHVKGFDNSVVFAPEVARDLHRLMELIDDQAKHADIIKGFDKALNIWKSAVTVYNPSFHIRNASGDLFVSYLNGMFVGRNGVKRALKSHTAAMKTMRALKWSKMDPAARIAMMGENPAFTGEALQEIGVGSHVLTVPRAFANVGDKITAEQLWGAYLKYGLKQAFTSTEFGKVVSGTRGVKGAASAANEIVRGISEGREDWFRLAHFADVLQRESLTERSFERAAAKAAEAVRKFHFDYSDFTPFERGVLTRAIPFYKWTRKSLPLMVEMLFAKPGAIAVYPKTLSSLSQMMGYEVGNNPLVPDSDSIIPDWIKNRGAVPIYTSGQGNTVFFDPSNPFNDTVRTWQGNNPHEFLTGQAEVQALLSMSNPILRVPTELATGRTFFGDYPIKGKEKQYLLQQSPQTNYIMKQINGDNSQLPASDRLTTPESLNKLFAMGTIENTPRATEGELRRINDILNTQRKATRKRKGYPEPR